MGVLRFVTDMICQRLSIESVHKAGKVQGANVPMVRWGPMRAYGAKGADGAMGANGADLKPFDLSAVNGSSNRSRLVISFSAHGRCNR